MKRKILFVGGHTGGHLFPAEAIAQALIDIDGVTPVYLDHGRTMEEKVFNGAGMEKISAPWSGRGRLRKVLSVPSAIKLLRMEKISALVAMGASPCVAPGLAAWRLGIPLYLHEQNREGIGESPVPSRAESGHGACESLVDPFRFQGLPLFPHGHRGTCAEIQSGDLGMPGTSSVPTSGAPTGSAAMVDHGWKSRRR